MKRPNNTKRPRAHPRSNGRKPSNPNRSFESNAPDGGKVRGNPSQLFERYSGFARDAQSAGDRIGAEGFWQYAEHYYRVLSASALRRNGNGEAAGNPGQNSNYNSNNNSLENGSGEQAIPSDENTEETPKETDAALN